jgi:sulfite exporter TauE/SafE
MSGLVVSALLMGLLGSGHCVAMCGGISSVVCAGGPKGRYAIAYNTGRILSYSVVGIAAGTLGSLPIGVPLDVLRFALRALAAVCLLSVGLHLVGLPSFVRAIESAGAPVWRRVAPLAKRMLPLRSSAQAFAAGGLWAFMPCGLLYGAVSLAASADSPLEGAMTMAAFGAGTLPVMMGVGLLARRVASALSHAWVRRVAGIVMLGFGLWSTAALADQVGLGRHGTHACCPR